MNIQCGFGKFKIIQSVSDKDELLVLSKWESLKHLFEASRIFMIDKRDAVFGVYLKKRECLEAINQMLKNIDYKDWDHLQVDQEQVFFRSNA